MKAIEGDYTANKSGLKKYIKYIQNRMKKRQKKIENRSKKNIIIIYNIYNNIKIYNINKYISFNK